MYQSIFNQRKAETKWLKKHLKKKIEREVEQLLRTAEDYLWRAKVNKSKGSQNFEVMLALEYVTKARA